MRWKGGATMRWKGGATMKVEGRRDNEGGRAARQWGAEVAIKRVEELRK